MRVVDARIVALAKPVVLDASNRAGADSIVGIVEGVTDLDGGHVCCWGLRCWIVRAARGNLRARVAVPGWLDTKLDALVGCLVRIGVDAKGVYYASREVSVNARAPKLMADRDDPSARYK